MRALESGPKSCTTCGAVVQSSPAFRGEPDHSATDRAYISACARFAFGLLHSPMRYRLQLLYPLRFSSDRTAYSASRVAFGLALLPAFLLVGY